jgi:hypothetical protein
MNLFRGSGGKNRQEEAVEPLKEAVQPLREQATTAEVPTGQATAAGPLEEAAEFPEEATTAVPVSEVAEPLTEQALTAESLPAESLPAESLPAESLPEPAGTADAPPLAARRAVKREARPDPNKAGWGRGIG